MSSLRGSVFRDGVAHLRELTGFDFGKFLPKFAYFGVLLFDLNFCGVTGFAFTRSRFKDNLGFLIISFFFGSFFTSLIYSFENESLILSFGSKSFVISIGKVI